MCALRLVGCGFDPRLGETKACENVTHCLLASVFRLELRGWITQWFLGAVPLLSTASSVEDGSLAKTNLTSFGILAFSKKKKKKSCRQCGCDSFRWGLTWNCSRSDSNSSTRWEELKFLWCSWVSAVSQLGQFTISFWGGQRVIEKLTG